MTFSTRFGITAILASTFILAQPVVAKDKDGSGNASNTEMPVVEAPMVPEGIVETSPSISLADFPVCETFNAGADSMICTCPPGFDAGAVWGSGPYTGDSNICTAAAHAGLISDQDYLIEVISRGANDRYPGTMNNGVTTRDWGAYGSSFDILFVPFEPDEGGEGIEMTDEVEMVEDTGDAMTSMLPQCARMPVEVETYACSCSGDEVSGSVWGSGPYTADSDICTAANHAGFIGYGGGDVTLIRLPGLESYAESNMNQVRTRAWGSYTSSFTFNWN